MNWFILAILIIVGVYDVYLSVAFAGIFVSQIKKRMSKKKEKLCCCQHDEFHDKWDTDCDNSFCLITGTPTENKMKYCPYCGRIIKEIK